MEGTNKEAVMSKQNPSRMLCRTEQLFIDLGAVLLHDGLKNPGQFEFPPDKVNFFTRYYRCRMDGEFINTWVKFIYDRRSGWADFEVTWRDPRTKRKVTETRRLSLAGTEEAEKEVLTSGKT